MFTAANPDDLRSMLLHMAAASAGEPTKRARIASWFRAALELLEDDPAAPIDPPVTQQYVFALQEIAESLSMAAEHAIWLAEDARRIRPPSR